MKNLFYKTCVLGSLFVFQNKNLDKNSFNEQEKKGVNSDHEKQIYEERRISLIKVLAPLAAEKSVKGGGKQPEYIDEKLLCKMVDSGLYKRICILARAEVERLKTQRVSREEISKGENGEVDLLMQMHKLGAKREKEFLVYHKVFKEKNDILAEWELEKLQDLIIEAQAEIFLECSKQQYDVIYSEGNFDSKDWSKVQATGLTPLEIKLYTETMCGDDGLQAIKKDLSDALHAYENGKLLDISSFSDFTKDALHNMGGGFLYAMIFNKDYAAIGTFEDAIETIERKDQVGLFKQLWLDSEVGSQENNELYDMYNTLDSAFVFPFRENQAVTHVQNTRNTSKKTAIIFGAAHDFKDEFESIAIEQRPKVREIHFPIIKEKLDKFGTD